MVKGAFWQLKVQPKRNDVHSGSVCFSGCYDAILTSKQCLFPLLQIPGQVSEAPFQAKTEEGENRTKGKKSYQKPQLKQTKNSSTTQSQVLYFLNDQSHTREITVSMITEEKATPLHTLGSCLSTLQLH